VWDADSGALVSRMDGHSDKVFAHTHTLSLSLSLSRTHTHTHTHAHTHTHTHTGVWRWDVWGREEGCVVLLGHVGACLGRRDGEARRQADAASVPSLAPHWLVQAGGVLAGGGWGEGGDEPGGED